MLITTPPRICYWSHRKHAGRIPTHHKNGYAAFTCCDAHQEPAHRDGVSISAVC
ncbi:hypothetical protein BIFGAL_02608 [Bifidobacterium gallicum DSM 20093 = LMG 11596]|uniref:Uncharacterized protein n=1 Tax=Bifidobacterium gallicum DSM 20093 = LMG 11596 TaxID=561180 RepID=D1NS53_9BIFI|nr:hypothetical protein BIFGAL_02608 [Bifidobacterium gallicum DSM 20093 = LMG 11596]